MNPSPAAEARKLSAEAHAAKIAEAEAQRREAAAARARSEGAGRVRAQEKWPAILEEIRTAARAGREAILVRIYSMQDRPGCSPAEQAYADTMRTQLTEAGFTVGDEYDKLEPVGSDPVFHHTVYSYHLLVTWPDKSKVPGA